LKELVPGEGDGDFRGTLAKSLRTPVAYALADGKGRRAGRCFFMLEFGQPILIPAPLAACNLAAELGPL